MREHLSILKSQDLVTDRASIIMQAVDGTFVEVFEWKSKAAMEQSHRNLSITEMWGKFAEVCDYIPLNELDEARKLFADFTPFYKFGFSISFCMSASQLPEQILRAIKYYCCCFFINPPAAVSLK